ncbi:isoprenyl transferase [Dolosigranulum pigrum]|jgi:di-trans,poly-cis-decaprenylcistransferase|uniref:Isoprenyl transferase n=1 Tax=Dolosigranulum pigrum TaxID=29394 RepID=A0A1S8KM86_9LACT|nr:isoprenyl transferase [Dolosigranulum pigrum]OOL80802.1 isoprenyl transferase [Dolosigranulum pigrum]QJS96558.1 isoprenyl transferase [Dolosigranulum pigrum]QJS98216.1 isoprenyl transferase [Dolosigranulum pigrum]QTJ34546.1 isoprenyl transferase [Dolosigranulum pigrum]QTJ36289.1 isoprenyl transferase [Dolosigranulum pigrum]
MSAVSNQLAVPKHVAIIMDGNGRWAKERGLKRTEGHREGMEAIRRVAHHAANRGVKVLTLYAFSTENWKRPPQEVHYLMKLPVEFFDRFVPELIENNIRVHMMGIEEKVPSSTLKSIHKAMDETKHCTGMVLNFAFNYGGRLEITEAIKTIAQDVLEGQVAVRDIDEELIAQQLFSNDLAPYSDIDLMIRTSGEQRLSNFMLWQNAYSEFYFAEKNWPDFNGELFDQALSSYQQRHRRYGGLA